MAKESKKSRNKRTERQKQVAQMQPTRTEANRKRKLAKHLKSQPNDTQSLAAVK